MVNDQLSQVVRRWVYRIRPHSTGPKPRPRTTLRLEEVEARLAPATLPPVTVETDTTRTLASGVGVQAAFSPTQPNNLVLVTTSGANTVAQYSNDGGATWAALNVPAVQNPAGGNYPSSASPSVAIDRAGNVYIVDLKQTADKTSGAVVLYKYTGFTGASAPVLSGTPKIIYRWAGQDPARNVVVAVDNNNPTYTDGSATWTDSLSSKPIAPVYVAWNSDATPLNGAINISGSVFNPNVILTAVSSDGGTSFTDPVFVSDDGYLPNTNTAYGSASPRVLFSPGSGSASNPGGRLVFTWNQIAGSGVGQIKTDTSSPDGGVTSQPVATTATFNGTTGPIADQNTTTYTSNVSLNLATFGQPTDLDVNLSLQHPNLATVSIVLIAPNGQRFTLLDNRQNADGSSKTAPGGGIAPGLGGGVGLGIINGSNLNNSDGVSLTFTDQAPRSINDPSNVTVSSTFAGAGGTAASLTGQFRPDTTSSTSQKLNALLASLTPAQLASGMWTLEVTDFIAGPTPPPAQYSATLLGWSLKFSGVVNTTKFGTDTIVTGTATSSSTGAVTGGADNINPRNTDVIPVVGVGPGVSVAYDTTVGAGSLYSGRMYVAYTGYASYLSRTDGLDSNDTDIYLVYSDNNGATWSTPTRVNDDYVQDNQTEGNRPQFMPTVTVDSLTGTVVVMWYDARNDAAGQRVATYIATSIDGGQSFSPRQSGLIGALGEASNQTYLNTPRVAIDAITQQVVTLEPTPTYLQSNGQDGVGTRQAVLAYGGRIVPLWVGNLNATGKDNAAITNVFTATVTTAAGPRVIDSDMGPVNGSTTVGGLTYNNTFSTMDGSRQLDGFSITFDRPIDFSTFNAADVIVQFRSASGGAGVLITVMQVEQISQTTFFVRFTTPQTGVGTYSYRVGPDIRDFVDNPLLGTQGNQIDQNADAIAGNTDGTDTYATPKPVIADTNIQPAFQGPYTDDSLPLIVAGPHLVSSAPSGQTAGISSVSINPDTSLPPTLNVTFDREVKPESFQTILAAGLVKATGPGGTTLIPISVRGVDAYGNTVTTPTRLFQLVFGAPLAAGSYTVTDLNGNPVAVIPDNVYLNTGAKSIDLTFDRSMDPTSFTDADVLQLIGPSGAYVLNTELAADVSATATTVTVVNLAAFPSSTGFSIQIDHEVMLVTDINTATRTLTVTRARNGTVAVAHVANPTVNATSLTAATSLSATTITVALTDNLPVVPGFSIKVDNEFMLVTAISGNTLTVARGQSGSVAVGHANNASVLLVTPSKVQTVTTLNQGVDNSVTTLKVNSLAGFPVGFQPLTIRVDNEVMIVTNVDTINMTLTVLRGQAGTTAAAHGMNAVVRLTFAVVAIGGTVIPGTSTTIPNTTFRVLFPQTMTVSGSYSIVIGPAIKSANGVGLDSNLNAGLDVLRGGATQGGTITTNTYTSKTSALTGMIDAVTTQLQVTNIEQFGDGYLPSIQVDNEYMLVIGVNKATNTLTVIRGIYGSAAATHAPGAAVRVAIATSNFFISSTLTTSITSAQNTVTVTDPTVFPRAPGFLIQIDSEWMRVTEVNGSTFTVDRGVNGTVASAHTVGAGVFYFVSTATVAVNVPDDVTIRQALQSNPNARITITTDITTSQVSDLIGTLVAPDGTRIVLFTQVGSNGPTQFRPTFDDGAGTPIQGQSGSITSGLFNPQIPLSALLGHGGDGFWRLEIQNLGSVSGGTLNGFSLTLPFNPASSGLSEPGADQFQVGFRTFIQDPTNPVSQDQWTPVGATTAGTLDNGQTDPTTAAAPSNAGRVNAIAVDPGDATGNTVYAGGANGGVWKTTNFLTTDPAGPTWIPLTDSGPAAGMAISSITVIARNNNPDQSIIFALTGEGNPTGDHNDGMAGNGTGAGTLQTGIGLLRSMDGGRTWVVLDSTDNDDADGNILPISTRGAGANQRDGAFFGTNGYKVIYDPNPTPTGDYYIYMALTGPNGGVWRSSDTGRTWSLVRAGSATDVALASGSVGSSGQLETLYAAFQADAGGAGGGVYKTTSAPFAAGMTLQVGGNPDGNIRDSHIANTTVTVQNSLAPVVPTGAVVTIAVPGGTNNPLQNQLYRDWIYAMVTSETALLGLYQSKDGGQTWTQIKLPSYFDANNNSVIQRVNGTDFGIGYGTNNETRAQLSNWTNNKFNGITIDPNDPNIVYLSGQYVIRVDTTKVVGPQTLTYFDNSSATQTGPMTNGTNTQTTLGGIQPHNDAPYNLGQTQGTLTVNAARTNSTGTYGNLLALPAGTQQYTYVSADSQGNLSGTQFLNLRRDPGNPFSSSSILFLDNAISFTNTGENATTTSYMTEALAGMTSIYSMITYVDPLTGKVRLIFGTAQGVATGVDSGDGTLDSGIGFSSSVQGSRNGNLQLGQFLAGAAQTSQAAADIAGALFYAMSDRNGFQVSAAGVIQTGNTTYTTGGQTYSTVLGIPPGGGGQAFFSSDIDGYGAGAGTAYPAAPLVASGTGAGVAVSPSGNGVAYQYRLPFQTDSDNGTGLAFIRQFSGGLAPWGPGTTQASGLSATAGGATDGVSQWDNGIGSGALVVNPFNPNAVLIGSPAGRVYLTNSTGSVSWQLVSDPLAGGTPIPNEGRIRALAFGAPDTTTTASRRNTDSFLYAGTQAGNVYATRNGGSTWTRIFNGAAVGDNSPIMKIEADPRPNSTDLFVVTQNGVYYVRYTVSGTTITPTTPTNLTGQLFNTRESVIFGANALGGSFTNSGANSVLFALQQGSLTSIAVDWRYDNGTSTGPVIYAAGDGGVFRTTTTRSGTTLSLGAGGWSVYPSIASGATVAGGFLPNTLVTDLDLSLGDFTYDMNTGLTSTNFAGGFNLLLATTYGRGQFAIRLNTSDLPFTSGPQVTQLENPDTGTTDSDPAAKRVRVDFNGPVDRNTFGADDVQLYYLPDAASSTGKLSAAVSDTATAITLQSLAGYPTTPGYRILVDNEIMLVTGVNTGTNTLTVTRAQGGTTAATHAVSAVVEVVVSVTEVDLVSINSTSGNPLNQFDVYFTPPSGSGTTRGMNKGTYRIVVNPTLSDLAGNQMNQNGNKINGEPGISTGPGMGGDAFQSSIFLNGPATTLTVTAQTSPAVAGQAYTIFVTATKFDPTINGGVGGTVTDTAFTGTVNLSSGVPGIDVFDGASKITQYTFQPGDLGKKSFTVTYTKATPPSSAANFTATDPDPVTMPNFGNGSLAVTVVGGTATSFTVGVSPAKVTAGSKVGSVVITGFDAFGNQASTYTGTVSFSLGMADSGATLNGTALTTATYTFSAADAGSKTFTNALILTVAGTQSLTVSDSKIPASKTSNSFTVQGGAATSLVLTGPSNATAGTQTFVTVTGRDQFGNLAETTSNLPVSFSSSDSQVSPGSGLPSGFTLTGASASFPVTLKTAGTQSVTLSSGVTVTTPTVNIQVSPANAAGSVAITGFPSPSTAGVAGAFQVQVFDPFGNAATTFTGTVTFSTSDPQGSVPTSYTFSPADQGVHTFQATLRTAGTQSITAQDTANPNAVSTQSGISVTASPIAGGVVVTPNQPSATAGTPTSFTVSVVDIFGNPLPGFTGTVTFSSSDPNASLPANYTFTAADAGTKVFQAAFTKAGPQTLTVSNLADPSKTGTSSAVSITPAAATRFTVTGFPSSIPAASTGTFTVTAFDQFGNVATNYTGTVRFSSSDVSATLPPATTLVNGTATLRAVLRTVGTHSITAQDSVNGSISGTQTGIFVTPTAATRSPFVAVGTDAGILNTVTVYDQSLGIVTQFNPFEQGFTGGVRVAMAQTPNPNDLRVVAVPGPGFQPDVRVYDKTAQRVQSFLPFETAFTGGLFVATGDFNRDGYDDYVITPDQGGGPRVVVLDGKTGAVMANFFGIDDPNFRGGARAAVGDVNGDGFVDLVVAAGFGGGPRVAVFDGQSVVAGNPTHLVPDFFAFEQGLRNGVYVSVADINGDGKGDLVFGAGPGGGPRVMVVDSATALGLPGGYADAIASGQGILDNFFAGNTANRGGVRVAASNLDNDEFADLSVGDGVGGGSRLTGYTGKNLKDGNTDPAFSLDTIPGFNGGIFVG